MSFIKDLKCRCCVYYDSFDGCRANFGCDFATNLSRLKRVAKEEDISFTNILNLFCMFDEED